MKHLGDIKKLSGYDLPIVDVITGGSPCQDLSVAGNREGLSGERSGLFNEQVRIIKEMRERDRANGRAGYLIRPRYMVWENVEGAFSSNKGRDFQSVLTEIARIADEGCPEVPMPEKGKWSKSGCVYDGMGRWSIAWRLHDAQFWGVPQRRKRIALVADFGGLSAPEILFERKGLSWNPAESGEEGEAVTGSIKGSVNGASRSYTLKIRGGVDLDCYGKRAGKGALVQDELSGTLGVSHHGNGYKESDVMYTLNSVEQHGVAYSIENHQASHKDSEDGHQKKIYDARGNGAGDLSPTITGDHQNRITDYTAIVLDTEE